MIYDQGRHFLWRRVVFEDRGSWVGIGLLILCGLSAGSLLGYIEAGEIARFGGPGWLGWLIIVLAFAAIGFSFWQSRRGGNPGNDVRGERRTWWKRGKK